MAIFGRAIPTLAVRYGTGYPNTTRRKISASPSLTHPTQLLFPIPDSRFPIPDSRFPIPDSRLPIPDSRFPIPHTPQIGI
ncbi:MULTISPECIES: hypothetical protein [unclassified Moorena]|uniref:hypothetical protein n=1 Tax=unclassified Moorena TaxID=2683338 RepID=UPI0013CAD9AF|nr:MULTISPECIES: hypothetical protein [unclassified Moorena]NEO22605.1 hypothetical protein [Moorena sp. SIO4A5]NEQ61567.1 hypothetical protein [Moorena sp. SIO4A1]